MSEPAPDPERLKDLTDAYLSDLLDEAGVRELETRLRADPEARRYFVRYARLHTDLHLEARARRAGARALGAIADLAPPPRPRRIPAALPVLAAAAAVLLVVAGFRLSPEAQPGPEGATREPAVAWLVNAQNCRWGDGAAAGDLRAGTTLSLERGLAELRFRCGARVVLEGPARLELVSGSSARLTSGRLTARVEEPAAGFRIESPQGRIIDLGTEFGVAVSDRGTTEVYVFDGKVEAHPVAGAAGVSLTRDEAARIAGGKVTRRPGAGGERFVRAIVPPPVIVPRTLRLAFDRAADTGVRDVNGLGTGLTHRLPGTGRWLPANDPNLRLDPVAARLELTTTRSDLNGRRRLGRGEYLGVRLSDLGFTGPEDFAVTATIPNMPALEDFGQFGLYAGTRSDRNIRGGLIKWGRQDPGMNTQFLVNNNGGRDTDLYKVGLLSPGTDLRLTLERRGGKYALTVENLTDGGTSTLTIRHPAFLDGEPDLYVGLFGANPFTDERKTLLIKDFAVTVWTRASRE
ncbi:MAG TPA: FecR family protein [Gemmataceae bacterium]